MNKTERITLYFREGSSDKVYQAAIEPKDGLFVVNFAYGRRGATLNSGTKISSPVDYETAKQLYDKLITEKKAKGYTEGPDGTPYRHSDKENLVTRVLPQLLNPVEEEDVRRLIQDRDHCAQEKYDGRRLLVSKKGSQIHGINRKGLIVGLPEPIFQSVHAIKGDFIMDGEAVGDVLYAFDLLKLNSEDLRPRKYQERHLVLMNLIMRTPLRNIAFVHTAFTPKQKRMLLEELKSQNKEGIVFKRWDAPYTPGRPNSGGPQLKHKFCSTLSAVVSKINGDKRSVEVRLLNGKGWIACGNVTIPVSFEVPKVGQVVEIRYLYAFRESNALYQPVYLGPRRDVEQHECVLSQIKYKSGGEEEAEC